MGPIENPHGSLNACCKTRPRSMTVSRLLGGYVLCHRRFDDGDVLLRRSTADPDPGDDLALAHERHAAAHRGVPTTGDGEEWIELRAWLNGGDEVCGAHADERGRVGLSLGDLKGKHRRSRHAVDENN